MYKVMLVDDEKLILQGLENIIEWEEIDLEIIATAQNGEEALEIFKNKPADIIITDINMPIISGLELIKKIREINNEVRFIILSGYEDFNYAKTAIKYGVDNYLLKPIDEEELTNTLKGIVFNIGKLEKQLNEEFTKTSIIKDYILEEIDFQEFKKYTDNLKIFSKNNYFAVSMLLLEKKIDYLHLKQKESLKFKDNLEMFYDNFGNIIMINAWEKMPTKNEINKYFNFILEEIKLKYNINSFIAIGKIVEKLEELPKSFKISNDIKKYILKYGFNNCLDETVIDKNINKIEFDNEINEINKLIIDKNEKAIEDFFDNNININKFLPKDIYDLSINVLILEDNIKKSFKINNGSFLGQDIIEILNLTDVDSIKKSLKKKILYLVDNIQQEDIKYSPIIKRVIKCVNERYSEDLSLKTLSVEYNINSSYLGQIFTKEVGYSFSDYLNKVRNIIAKDLILNSNKKITDIAKAVGYIDTSYFYRKFKKYYGVTPSALRDLKKY